jgi:predicted nucleic-acid-binding Zn-ribbon protein
MILMEEYPKSRISHSGYCDQCRTNKGVMEDSHLQLQDSAGRTIDFLKWTCNRCGYTMLFDLDVVLSRPPANDVNETFPDWVKRLLR